MKIQENFVVFEGGDGSGTTTQLKKLKGYFETNAVGLPPLFDTNEPTDGSIGRLLRQGLRGEIRLQSETIAFLFAADRNEHIFGPNGIQEHCNRGELVVCDRYVLSSLVYQGITCGDEFPARLNRDFPLPELLIFFDLDPEIALERMDNRTQKEIFETLDFQIQVRNRYKALLPALSVKGCQTVTIDASLPVDEVFSEVWKAMGKMPIIKR
ncbi:MAG: dTMP kinase [Treponema sp.]|jgi:dTMP kinase|nr:dTMP kinase [Treponema sp.]